MRMYDDAHTNTRQIATSTLTYTCSHKWIFPDLRTFIVHSDINSKSSRSIFYVLSSVVIAVRLHLVFGTSFKRNPTYNSFFYFEHTIKMVSNICIYINFLGGNCRMGVGGGNQIAMQFLFSSAMHLLTFKDMQYIQIRFPLNESNYSILLLHLWILVVTMAIQI